MDAALCFSIPGYVYAFVNSKVLLLLHFKNQETDAQKSQVACLICQSWDLNPGLSDFVLITITLY